MAIKASITLDLSVNSRAFSAYKLFSLSETEEPPTERLEQRGPVWNNQLTRQGVFRTRRDAVAAVLGFVDAPCDIIDVSDYYTEKTEARLMKVGTSKAKPTTGIAYALLGRKSKHGIYLTNA